jgi:hypothetical protein
VTGPGPANGSAKLDRLEEAEAAAQADERRRITRYSFVGRLAVIAAVVMVFGIFGGGYLLLNALKDTQATMVAIQRQTRACVTPGTACSDAKLKQDQATIAAIIGGTNEFSLYAAYCADRPGHQSLDKIRACAAKLFHPN